MPSPTVSSVAREQARRAPAVLTARGHAAIALLRFERAWAALGPDDRVHFADRLAELAFDSMVAA